VLLVDDSTMQLRAWSRDLEADSRTVFAAETPAQAMEIARSERPDVAIVDLFLGSVDGLALVRQLKQLDPALFVVVVSGDMSVAHAMAAVRAGADDVLVKPFIPRDVVRRIETGELVDPERTALTLEQIEWEHISRALLESGQNITQAAERLGIYRQTLQRKLRKRDRERAGSDSELADLEPDEDSEN
jgi:two-component system response regulator RegA